MKLALKFKEQLERMNSNEMSRFAQRLFDHREHGITELEVEYWVGIGRRQQGKLRYHLSRYYGFKIRVEGVVSYLDDIEIDTEKNNGYNGKEKLGNGIRKVDNSAFARAFALMGNDSLELA
ncbi:hypothetical protein VA249_29780 [Vibrio alfacsensis]|uniref:hypothetical protein n=1 Tax=Vibrio alfacsensis TaxID=1074311 RepID=UPI001BED48F2|nr:hypothetical protein [Vibrio alfacsensis]BBM66332.1 hypothetical protein VA249_29780 [Vibrio alfacsensis]